MSTLVRKFIDPKKNSLAHMHMEASSIHSPFVDTAVQTPFRSYLQEMLALVEREKKEREALGALPLYQRTFP